MRSSSAIGEAGARLSHARLANDVRRFLRSAPRRLPMRFTFVVPGLASARPRHPRVVASARAPRVVVEGARRAARPRRRRSCPRSASPSSDPRHDVPAAPLAALGAGVDPRTSFVLAAEPVALVAGRDDVAIAGAHRRPRRPTRPARSSTRWTRISRPTASRSSRRARRWYATLDARPDLTTTPLDDALGAMMSRAPALRARRAAPGSAGRPRSRCSCTPIRSTSAASARASRRATACGSGAAARSPTSAWSRRFARTRPKAATATSLRGLARLVGGESMMLPGSFEAAFEAVPATRPASHVAAMLAADRRRGVARRRSTARGSSRRSAARARPHRVARARHRRRRTPPTWARIGRRYRRACAPASPAPFRRSRTMIPRIVRRAVAAGRRGARARGRRPGARAPLRGARRARRRRARPVARRIALARVDEGARRAPRNGSSTRSTRASASSSSPTTTPTARRRARSACARSRRWAPTCASSCRTASSTATASRRRSSSSPARSARASSSPWTTASRASTASPRPTAHGIDVLVTDHHLPGERLPAPALIVNPNQPGCAFPSKHIAGVGVMFYVLAATRALLRERGRDEASLPNLAALLDLVALGTVADVVRLDRTNRILVDQGLEAHPRRPRARRRRRAVRGRRARRVARDRHRPGLRRRAARERGRAARRHVARHPLPGHRRRARGAGRSPPSSTG